MEEACEALSGKQQVGEKDSEVYQGLLTGDADAMVTYLGEDASAVPAEPVTDLAVCAQDIETTAMPAPVRMEIAVPTGNWDKDKPFVARGPSGPINVRLPQDATPGSAVLVKLSPKPEYRFKVPPGGKPGSFIKFQKQSGEEVAITVPKGLQPGDTFDVTPPALMVRVPDNAKAGDYVTFFQLSGLRKDGSGGRKEIYRARVPEGCVPWDHFSAILPPPPQGMFRPE